MSNQRAHHNYATVDKKRVFKLREYGLTEREIAESMGISKAHVHMILKCLKPKVTSVRSFIENDDGTEIEITVHD